MQTTAEPNTIVIAFCEQIAERCRGYAADDHIQKECHTIAVTSSELADLTTLLESTFQRYKQKLNSVCDEWHKAHPDEEECLCEGPEFVGLRWIEWNAYKSGGVPSSSDTAYSEIKERVESYADNS